MVISENTIEEQKSKPSRHNNYLFVFYALLILTLLVMHLFTKFKVDEPAIYLLALLLVPLLLPLIKKIKYKEFEFEIEQFQTQIAELSNQTHVKSDESKKLKVSPYEIRLKHDSKQRNKYFGDKYYKVKVWLEAPKEFVGQINKVVYERHSTFKNRFKEIENSPMFEDSFLCWGAFTIKATIHLEDGKELKRQRYLSLD